MHCNRHLMCVVLCVTTGYHVFTSVITQVHIVCTALVGVLTYSIHTARNKTHCFNVNTSVACEYSGQISGVRVLCWKVHTSMSVCSPRDMDVPHNTHLRVRTTTHIHYVCCVQRYGVCPLVTYCILNNGTKILYYHYARRLRHSSRVRGDCTPHCSVHAASSHHKDQVPKDH